MRIPRKEEPGVPQVGVPRQGVLIGCGGCGDDTHLHEQTDTSQHQPVEPPTVSSNRVPPTPQ
ncbi:hypothetical protein [Leekyejoonella antrihumi]|uniref:Uncharacterized protein n=1 Tax=Leekyejoonella antrihumi TaxID=1660198 RepID=A0A563E4Q4_9MICO|nr:hypothetical protein [Leekyejoonella antrihumi]TWP36854.1 hypothetical protein FGL98_08865 [Leekyejoonella antrihumi]